MSNDSLFMSKTFLCLWDMIDMITNKTVSRWETGAYMPDIDKLQAVNIYVTAWSILLWIYAVVIFCEVLFKFC